MCSCTSPDTVQLSGYQGSPDQGLYASIPICMSLHPLALGDTLQEVREKTLVYSETNSTGLENYSTLEWKEHDAISGCDSILRCTFRNQRLVHFSSETYLSKLSNDKNELSKQIDPLYSCLSEVRPILFFGKNLSYIEADDAYVQRYQVVKSQNQFAGFHYEIGYIEDSIKVTIAAHS